MAYTVEDIVELARYHLALSTDNPDEGCAHIAQLIQQLDHVIAETWGHGWEGGWLSCEGCGTSVSAELIRYGAAGYNQDAGFYCSDCRLGSEAADAG